MRTRDKAILNDLARFRCLSRDDIVDLHFKGLKQGVKCCNNVLKRLRRDGHIEANTQQQPYIYFSSPSPIKKDSQKIPHFLAIVNVYKQLLEYDIPKQFTVEPKYGKDFMEPDIFTRWRKTPLFIEVQRSIYSEKVMYAKLQRYLAYYHSYQWQNESWQPKGKTPVFPKVLIITDTRYDVGEYPFMIQQATCIKDLIEKVEEPQKPINSGIIINGGTNLRIKN